MIYLTKTVDKAILGPAPQFEWGGGVRCVVGYCCGGFRLPGLECLGGTLALPGGTGTISQLSPRPAPPYLPAQGGVDVLGRRQRVECPGLV